MLDGNVGEDEAPIRWARTVGIGVVIGTVLAIMNVYIGLKTDWWDSGGIIALLVGFVLLGGRAAHASARTENVLAQTLASSAAAMPSAMGILGAIPALDRMGIHISTGALLMWGAGMGALGLALAHVLREPIIVREQLPFPSAVAIAEVASSLHGTGSKTSARSTFLGALVSGVFTWFRDGKPAWIPQVTWLPFRVAGAPAERLSLGLSLSPLLLSLGAMMGFKNGVALGAGAAVAWGLIAPQLIQKNIVHADYASVVEWLLWPGAAMMTAGGLASIALEWRTLRRAWADVRGIAGKTPRAAPALLALGILTAALSHVVFDIPVWASVALLVSTAVSAVVCIRVVGEAAVAPFSQLGQMTQLGIAAAGGATPLLSVGGASMVAGGIVEASQLSESFKVGLLTGVAPRRQMWMAAVGVAVGVLTAAPVYGLITRVHGIGSPTFPAPGAIPWKALAELGSRGAQAVPSGAGWAAIMAFVVGVGLELARHRKVGRNIPSPILLGLPFLLPVTTSGTLFAGSLLTLVFTSSRRELESVGAGAIAAESIVGMVIAILLAYGHLASP